MYIVQNSGMKFAHSLLLKIKPLALAAVFVLGSTGAALAQATLTIGTGGDAASDADREFGTGKTYQILNLTDGGKVSNDKILSGGTLNMTGGEFLHLSASGSGAIANISGGVAMSNDSNVGTTFSSNAELNQTGGMIYKLYVKNGATANRSGGNVSGGTNVYANSILNLSGNSQSGSVYIRSGSVVNVSEGANIAATLEIYNNAGVAEISGGTIHTLSVHNRTDHPNSDSRGTSGIAVTANLTGGKITNNLLIGDQGIVNMSGGTIADGAEIIVGRTEAVDTSLDAILNLLGPTDPSKPVSISGAQIYKKGVINMQDASVKAANTTVNNGGTLNINAGIATNTKVNNGGVAVLKTAGTADGKTTLAGGEFQLEGGTLKGTLEGNGQVTQVSGDIILPDDLEVTACSTTTGNTLSFNQSVQSSGILSAGSSATLQVAGDITVSGSGKIQLKGEDGRIEATGAITAAEATSLADSGANGGAIQAGGDISLGTAGGSHELYIDLTSTGGGVKTTAGDLAAGKITAVTNISSYGSLTAAGDITTTSGSVSSAGLLKAAGISAVAGAVSSAGDLEAASITAKDDISSGGDFTATGNITTSDGSVSSAGDMQAAAITAGNDISSGGSLKADQASGRDITALRGLEVIQLTAQGRLLVRDGAIALDSGSVDGAAQLFKTSGRLGSALIAGTGEISDSALQGGVWQNGLNLQRSSLASNDVDTSKDIMIDGASALTIGSQDSAPLAAAISNAGRQSGLSLHRPIDLGGQGSLAVGSGVTAAAGEAVFGPDAVLDVQAAGVGAYTPLITAGSVRIDKNAALHISGGTEGQEITVYAVNTAYGTFLTMLTDNGLYVTDISDNEQMQRVLLGLRLASDNMPNLDEELKRLIDDAQRNREIGTFDPDLQAAEGGRRFLSRGISSRYGSKDPEEASAAIESLARVTALAGVPQMARAASWASADAVFNRLRYRPGSSLHSASDVAPAAGDSPDAFVQPGLELWVTPLYQHLNSSGFNAGHYELDLRYNLGGIALGADYTTRQALRLGLSFSTGTGYAKGSGDLSRTTNHMSFWGIGAYAGWAPGPLTLAADVNFTSTYNRVKQEMLASMDMAELKDNINAHALSGGLRAEYAGQAGSVEVIPHIGLRHTWVVVDDYTVKSGALDVLSGKRSSQNIWSFPLGVTLARDIETESGWMVRPSLDLRLVPYVGDVDSPSEISFSGVSGEASLHTRTMDWVTYGGALGLELGRDNLKFGLRYDLDAGKHSLQQGVFASMRYEF